VRRPCKLLLAARKRSVRNGFGSLLMQRLKVANFMVKGD
jgi:hypothetical protein